MASYGRVVALHDGVTGVRFHLAPGLLYFIKGSKMSFSGEVGPGAVIEKLDKIDKIPITRIGTAITLRVAERFNSSTNVQALTPNGSRWMIWTIT
jgi:hypothetical protein